MGNKFKFHYTPIPKNKEKWLQNRQSGIGGSEVGTVLGLNPYESSIELFYRKIGLLPLEKEDNMAMFMGRFLEDKIAELWEYNGLFEETTIQNYQEGIKRQKCQKVDYTIRNNEFPHLLANLDRMILPELKYEAQGYGVLEIKTITSYATKNWEDGIPPYHLAQLQTYLIITGWDYGEIAMLVDGRKLEIFEFGRDEDMIEDIIEKTEAFWGQVELGRKILASSMSEYEKQQALKEIEPNPNASVAWENYLKNAYTPEDKVITGTDEIMDIAINLELAKQALKEAEERKTLYSNQLKYIMQEATEIYFAGNGKITWKPDSRGVRTLRTNLKHYEKV